RFRRENISFASGLNRSKARSGKLQKRRRRRSTAKNSGKKRGAEAPLSDAARASGRVIHHEFDRVRRMFEPGDLTHLQLNIAVDEIVIEHPAGLEEGSILVERLQGFPQ